MIGTVVLLFVVVPFYLACWFLCLFYFTHYQEHVHGHDQLDYQPVPPIKLVMAILLPFAVTLKALRSKSLSYSGALASLVVGSVLTLVNYCFMASMLTFFIFASKATKINRKEKSKFEKDIVKAGQRTWIQVFCNGGIATQLALFYYLDSGFRETPIDFSRHYNSSWWSVSVMAAISCSCGDTFASELGPVLPLSQPFLITTLRRVPKGTNGGVSVAGTISSLIGGLIVGGAYFLSLQFWLQTDLLESAPPQWPVVVVCGISGLLGSMIDSILGATLQFSGIEKDTGFIVETPGANVRKISGSAFLDNNAINLLSSILTSLIMPRLSLYMWPILHH